MRWGTPLGAGLSGKVGRARVQVGVAAPCWLLGEALALPRLLPFIFARGRAATVVNVILNREE